MIRQDFVKGKPKNSKPNNKLSSSMGILKNNKGDTLFAKVNQRNRSKSLGEINQKG